MSHRSWWKSIDFIKFQNVASLTTSVGRMRPTTAPYPPSSGVLSSIYTTRHPSSYSYDWCFEPSEKQKYWVPSVLFLKLCPQLKHALSAGMVYPAYWPSCGPSFTAQNLRFAKCDEDIKNMFILSLLLPWKESILKKKKLVNHRTLII